MRKLINNIINSNHQRSLFCRVRPKEWLTPYLTTIKGRTSNFHSVRAKFIQVILITTKLIKVALNYSKTLLRDSILIQ